MSTYIVFSKQKEYTLSLYPCTFVGKKKFYRHLYGFLKLTLLINFKKLSNIWLTKYLNKFISIHMSFPAFTFKLFNKWRVNTVVFSNIPLHTLMRLKYLYCKIQNYLKTSFFVLTLNVAVKQGNNTNSEFSTSLGIFCFLFISSFHS